MKKAGFVAVVALFTLFFIVLGPVVVIWALNTLGFFGPLTYSFWNILAVLVLMIVFGNMGLKKGR